MNPKLGVGGSWDTKLGCSGGGRKLEGSEPQNLGSGPQILGSLGGPGPYKTTQFWTLNQDTKFEDTGSCGHQIGGTEIWRDWRGQDPKIWGVRTQNSGLQSSNLGIWGIMDLKFGGFRMQTPGKRPHFEMKILFLISVLSQQIERCVYSIN